MNSYYILVNGKTYSGESVDTYPSNYGGDGWHVNNNRCATVLLFGGDPYKIEGFINLKSHLDRILKRSRDGYLDIEKIEINIAPDGAADKDYKDLRKFQGKFIKADSLLRSVRDEIDDYINEGK